MYCRRMTLEAEKSHPLGSEDAPSSAATPKNDEGKEKEPWRRKVLLQTAGGIATVLAAFITGNYLIGNTEKAFLKEQRIVAYGEYVEDLLTLELKYKDGTKVLEKLLSEQASIVQGSPSEEAKASILKAQVLFDELETALDDVTRSKSVVDVVGSRDVVAVGETSINLYGRLKGEMQDHLLARSTGAAPPESALPSQEALSTMRTEGREPFSGKARANLAIPDQ